MTKELYTRLKEGVLAEHSKYQTLELAKLMVGPEEFAVLVDVLTTEAQPVPQRIAWVLDTATDPCQTSGPLPAFPELVRLLRHYPKAGHPAERRAIMKLFTRVNQSELPEEFLGELLDLAFGELDDASTPVAIRVHAMQICYEACLLIPELTQEFRSILNAHLPTGSAGFKSRATKLLAALQKRS